MNKRAQIGSTITWFFAIIAIFLILIIFFVFSGVMAAKKIAYSEKFTNDLISSSEDVNYFSLRAATVFLESPYKNETRREYFSSSLNIEGISDEEVECYAYCFELPGFLAGKCFPPETSFRIKKAVNVSLIDFAEKSKEYNQIKFEAWNNCEK